MKYGLSDKQLQEIKEILASTHSSLFQTKPSPFHQYAVLTPQTPHCHTPPHQRKIIKRNLIKQ
jgi:hypothetical protein